MHWLNRTLNLIVIMTLMACGGPVTENTNEENAGATGSLAIQVQWPESSRAASADSARGATFPCAGIGQIKVEVWNSHDAQPTATDPGTWTCAMNGGTISGIPVGNDYTVVFMAMDDGDLGQIVYYGQATVDIVAKTPAQAQISAVAFQPQLDSPDNNSSANSVTCQWICPANSQDNGIEYELRVSTLSNMASPNRIVTTACQAQPTNLLIGTYFWQVAAQDHFGHARLSSVRSFSVNLGSPTYLSPANGAVLPAGPVSFSWSGPGASYRFTLSTNTDLTAPLVSTNLDSLSHVESTLEVNQTYYWQVAQLDGSNTPGTPSSVNHFTVQQANLSLTSPEDGAYFFRGEVELIWTPIQPAPFSYEVTITQAGGAPVLLSQGGASNRYVPLNLPAGATFSWQVGARNSDGVATHISSSRTFYTIGKPSLESPAPNVTRAAGTFDCQWSSTYPGGLYRFEIADNAAFAQPNPTEIQDDTYKPTGLTPGQTYFWRVVPLDINRSDNSNTTYYSEIRQINMLGVPAPSSPENDTYSVDVSGVTFGCTAVANAALYRVILSTTSTPLTDSGAMILTTEGNVTSIPLPSGDLQHNTTYYWQVAALDSAGQQGTWSTQIFNFTTKLAPPQNVTATPGSRKNTITFDPVQGADQYTLHWGTIAGTQTESIGNIASGFVHTNLQNSTAYYYRVEASNVDNDGELSAEASATPDLSLVTVGVQKLTATDPQSGDRFGWAVDIDGDYAIVGAPYENGGSNDSITHAGAAYIFHRDAMGRWGEGFKITAPTRRAIALFGQAVAISGSDVLVGEPGNNSAYIYRRTSSNAWTRSANFLTGGVTGGGFGSSVAIKGNSASIGCPGWTNDIFNPPIGAVYGAMQLNGVWSLYPESHAPSNPYIQPLYFGGAVALTDSIGIYACTNGPVYYTTPTELVPLTLGGNDQPFQGSTT